MTADDTVTAKLAEWETLTEAATEGPWEADGTEISQHWSRPEPWLPIASDDVVCMAYCYGGSARGIESEADAEFIAAARTAMPALLGFVEDMRALHVSSSESRGVGRVDPETGEWGAYCDHDGDWWPCPTVQALTKRIGGEG